MGILARTLKAREGRATLRNPVAEWLVDALTGGSSTLSGETISPNSAMSISAYYAVIRVIAEDVGKLPFMLYRRVGDRGKERLTSDPLYRLIHDEPNPEMSSQTFRETLTEHAIGWGNGFAEIQLRGERPIALWPLDPARVRVERNKETRQLVYVVSDDYRTEFRIMPDRMFHVHGLGFDGLTGYSLAKVAKQTLGLAKAQEKSAAALFGNYGRPGGVLETPNAMTDDAMKKLAAQWQRTYGGGAENWYKVAVLEQGLSWKPLSPIAPEDAEWIAERQFSVEEICRWGRVPPHKIQHLLRSTFNNISHQSIEYVVDTLLAWLKRWEAEVWRKLIPRSDQADVFAEHVVEGLLQGDFEQQSKLFAAGRQWGYMSVNDIREKLNMNPIGPEGDIYLEPENMHPAGQEPKAAPPAPPAAKQFNSDAVVWAHLPVMCEAYGRLLKIEGDRIQRAARKGELDKWADKFYASHVEAARDAFDGPLWAFAGTLWAAAINEPAPGALRQIAANHAAEAACRHVEKSQTQRIPAYRESKGTMPFDKRDDGAARHELQSLAARIQPLLQQR